MNDFIAEKVTERITRIRSNFEVCMYYVQGDEQGALLDTGMGSGDLKSFVDSIATTSYKVILSHGHCDHAGGSGQFSEVYLSSLDYELEKRHCNLEFRIEELHNAPVPFPDNWTKEKMIPQKETSFLELTEEMIFELGGVTIKPILVSGHTKGMMVFLIPEEQVAIFGDASGENTLICFPESTTIQEHYLGLQKLKSFEGKYQRILRNHGTFESPTYLLDNNLATCKKIISRTDAKLSIHIHGIDAFSAKNREALLTNEEKVGNIVYTLDKLI
ncbi:MAG: MBL fold metallo-hydrolase [Enterococcus lemanii]|jgi:hydroxyacylglutathione hydrolase